MMAIFNFFGSILGYLLWFLYNIFHNYGVAIIFFTIIIKAVLFPFSVKSQRSMASQTKLADKQKELQAKYGNNKQKYNEELMKLYEKYGWYGEKTLNLVMPGLDGLKKMADLMASLREKPPVEIAGVGVLQQKDYQDGSVVNVGDGAKSTMELSGSNVLRYEMADGTSLIVRPSGTEPKVKVYILANDASREACDAKVAKYAVWAESLKK